MAENENGGAMSRLDLWRLVLGIQLGDLMRLADERVITSAEAGALWTLACIDAVRRVNDPEFTASHWPSDGGAHAVAALDESIKTVF